MHKLIKCPETYKTFFNMIEKYKINYRSGPFIFANKTTITFLKNMFVNYLIKKDNYTKKGATQNAGYMMLGWGPSYDESVPTGKILIKDKEVSHV